MLPSVIKRALRILLCSLPETSFRVFNARVVVKETAENKWMLDLEFKASGLGLSLC